MDVPYISQLDPLTGSGGNNCGPASLAMLLAHEGVIAPTYGAMLHVADIVRDGLDDGRGQTGGYTTWQQLMGYAEALGQQWRWIGDWRALYAALAEGQPAIVLLSNWLLLPRQYPINASFNAHHFVVLCEYRPDRGTFLVNDPLSVYVRGPVEYSALSVVQAVSDIGSVQALCLEPLWKEPAPADEPAPEVTAALEAAGVTNVAEMTEDQKRKVGQHLYGDVPFVLENGIPAAYIGALEQGKYLGVPAGGEAALGDEVYVQKFLASQKEAVIVYTPDTGAFVAE